MNLPQAIFLGVFVMGAVSSASLATAQKAPVLPREAQIAAAILPLPVELRSTASVMGYSSSGQLVALRDGSGNMTCLASDPQAQEFHVACYYKALEPFMARGRALRSQGVKGPQVDSVRFREIKAGTLKLPSGPSSLYTLTGGKFDPKAGSVTGAQPLFVVYIPYATVATTGLSERPAPGAPWIMYPGTPKAHIMFVPKM
jgi:hypothetical protein